MDKAFVTLATNDSYCLGALVVASSLRLVNTSGSIVCMITPQVSEAMRLVLEKSFNKIYLVDVLDSKDADNLLLLERPNLGVTFTKLHCWRLEEYKKCVFLDADTLVLSNCDELFDRDELSAAPDPGWPDCFNSGVFVYTPSKNTYKKLVEFAAKEGSFDGGDQGLLNLYFSDWAHTDISKHLPFLYNVVSQAFYSYLPAFKRFGGQTKICHFIGPVKPWHHSFNESTGTVVEQSSTGFSSEFLHKWWQIFLTYVQPLLSPQRPGSSSLQSAEACSVMIAINVIDLKVMTPRIPPVQPLEPQVTPNAGETEVDAVILSTSATSSNELSGSLLGWVNTEQLDTDKKPVSTNEQCLESNETEIDGSELTKGCEKDLLMPQLAGLRLSSAAMSGGEASLAALTEGSSSGRQENWERGIIDYRGVDSFEEIKKHLDMSLTEESAPHTDDIWSRAATKDQSTTTSSVPTLDTQSVLPAGAHSGTDMGAISKSQTPDVRPKVPAADRSQQSSVTPSVKPIKSALKKPK